MFQTSIHIGIWPQSVANVFRNKEKRKKQVQNWTWKSTLKRISPKSPARNEAFRMVSHSSSEGLWELSKVYACCLCIFCNSLRDFMMWKFKRKYLSSCKHFSHFPTVLLFQVNTQQYTQLHINSCSYTGAFNWISLVTLQTTFKFGGYSEDDFFSLFFLTRNS